MKPRMMQTGVCACFLGDVLLSLLLFVCVVTCGDCLQNVTVLVLLSILRSRDGGGGWVGRWVGCAYLFICFS